MKWLGVLGGFPLQFCINLGSKNSWGPCNLIQHSRHSTNCPIVSMVSPMMLLWKHHKRPKFQRGSASLPRLLSEREGLAVLALESISGWFTRLQILHLSPWIIHECTERNKITHPSKSKSKSRNKNYSAPVLRYDLWFDIIHDQLKHVCPSSNPCFSGCLRGQSLHIRVTAHASLTLVAASTLAHTLTS